MTILNMLKTALQGLSKNKLRSSLTTLGIIIGVSSVIVMVALGNGAKEAVAASFQFLGSDVVQISPKQIFDDGAFQAAGEILSYEDGLKMADEIELVERVQMNINGNAKIRFGRNVLDMNVSGVTADVLETLVMNQDVQPVDWPETEPLNEEAFIGQGRFFTPAEVMANAEVCVLGSETALDLFGGDNPVGESIMVNRQRCLVVGVLTELETTDADERYQNQPNQGLYMPISTAIKMLHDEEPSVYITARVSDEKKIDQAKAQIAAYLRERHQVEKNEEGTYQDDFEMTTRKDILGAQQQSAKTFSLLLTAMAIVSLVVGGIGIMNVMLVSVSERTREIGVRLAIGAAERDIVFQFLSEAIILSAGGGIVGTITGILIIPLAAKLNQGIAVLAPESIPLAFGLALITGMVFGIYPAVRAARLIPVEALRYE